MGSHIRGIQTRSDARNEGKSQHVSGTHFRIAGFFIALCLPLMSAQAQPTRGGDHAAMDVVSERDALVPGETQWLAVRFDIEKDWHLYWKNPGDSGEPPIIRWELPDGVTVGDPLWPAPQRHVSSGGILDYIFEYELAILYPVEVSRDLPTGKQLTIKAESDYLICKSICLFGDGSAELTLPVRRSSNKSNDTELFERTRTFIPGDPESSSELGIETRWENRTLDVAVPGAERITFYPHSGMDAPAPRDMIESGQTRGETIRITYPDLRKASAVTAVLEIEYPDRRIYQELCVPTPDGTARDNHAP